MSYDSDKQAAPDPVTPPEACPICGGEWNGNLCRASDGCNDALATVADIIDQHTLADDEQIRTAAIQVARVIRKEI